MKVTLGAAMGELEGLSSRSTVAMLLADDARRYVDVNEAACALLGRDRKALLSARVDDLTPIALRGSVATLWERFLAQGTMQGVYELSDGIGEGVRVTYVAIARVLPDRHLSYLLVSRADRESDSLTARERDVVALAAHGLTSGAIAETLTVSRSTVESHFRGAVRRLGARNRTHAIALALAWGEIALSPVATADPKSNSRQERLPP
jgi:DNA-binding CsgD family transcriptional regulator